MNKIYIYFMMFLLGFVGFVYSAGSVDVVTQSMQGSSIVYYDNYYYITCLNCSSLGVNSGLDKYNYITDTHSNFGKITNTINFNQSKFLNDGSWNRNFPPLTLITNDYALQIIYFVNDSLTNNYGFNIYKYSYITGYWTQYATYTPPSLNSARYTFDGFAFYGSTYKGYDYNFYEVAYVNQLGNLASQTIYTYNSQTGTNGSEVDHTGAIGIQQTPFKSDQNTLTKVYMHGGRIEFNNTFYNVEGASAFSIAWADITNDNFILITKGALSGQVYYSDNKLNLSNNTIWTDLPGCSDIINLPLPIRLNDIDCKDKNDCVIVGSYDTDEKPLLFQYSAGVGCQYIDVYSTTGSNSPIYSVDYAESGQFGFVGTNILGFVTTSSIGIEEEEIVIAPEVNFTVTIEPRIEQIISGNFIISSAPKWDYVDGIYDVYVSPTTNMTTIEYTINSTTNGYSKTECNALNIGGDTTIISENFNNCNTTSDLNWLPQPSNYQFTCTIINPAFGKSLHLFNGTYGFRKVKLYNEIINTDYNRYSIRFDYHPEENTTTIFSLMTANYLEELNIVMDTDDNNTCFYSVPISVEDEDNRQVLNCVPLTNDYISNNIVFDTVTNKYYLINTINEIDYTSAIYDTINSGFIFAGVQIRTTQDKDKAGTYLDNIVISGLTNDISMNIVTIPYDTSCSYINGNCYTTKIYFSTIATDFTNYREFRVCAGLSVSDAITLPPTNPDGSPNEATAFINTIPILWRYLIMIITVLTFFLLPMILAGQDGVIGGLAVSAIIALTLTIILGLSIIIPIVYIIISGGIIALLVRKTVAG